MGFRSPRSGQPGVRACCGGRLEPPTEQGSHAPTQIQRGLVSLFDPKGTGPRAQPDRLYPEAPRAPRAAQSPRVLARRPPPLPTPAAWCRG